MNPLALVTLLRTRAELGSRQRWSRAQLEGHQAAGLAALRAYAYAHSPFYREFHRGLEAAPMSELPVLTKSAVMDHFDELVTDRQVRRAEVEDYLARASATDTFRGRYGWQPRAAHRGGGASFWPTLASGTWSWPRTRGPTPGPGWRSA